MSVPDIEPTSKPVTPPREFGISTANVLDPKTALLLAGMPLNQHIQLARESGYEGVEVWPMNPWIAAQILTGLAGVNPKHVLSVHQSPVQESFSQVSLLKPHTLGMLRQLLVLPGMTNSLKYLEKMAAWKPEIPAVVYEQSDQKKLESSQLPWKFVQIRPETIQQWQATDIVHFVNIMVAKGYTGICFDWTHFLRSNIGDWQVVVPYLVKRGVLKEVHLSVGRTDLGADIAERSKKDLSDLTNIVANSEIIKFLQLLNNTGWTGEIVVELLPSAIKALRAAGSEYRLPIVTRHEMKTTYEKIRIALYATLEGPHAG